MKRKTIACLFVTLCFFIQLNAQDIFSAAAEGDLGKIKQLIKENHDLANASNEAKKTALHIAAENGYPEIVTFLVKEGADFTAQNSTGTVLHTAAMLGRLNLARLLIEIGADVNSKNNSGITPLYYAIYTGNDSSGDLAMLLINNGADVNAADKNGTSVLMVAVQQGFPNIVEHLISKGADKTIRDVNTNQTLLHYAAISGYGDVAEILIHSGLDVNARDRSGKTPLQYAKIYGNKTVADPLVKAGAETDESESNFGDSKFVMGETEKGEAYIWLLKNRGYIVKTMNHLFVFDNEETGRKPDDPSVDNGHYSLSELQNQPVLAIYSDYHARANTMEFIHALEDSIKNITCLHYKGDFWRGGNKSLYLKGHEEQSIYGAEILTMEAHEEYGMGSLDYLIKVDGLTFFYSPFPTTKMEEFKKEVDFIADHVDSCDFAFIMAMTDEGEACRDYILEKLEPKAMLPMGHKSLHKNFENFTRQIADIFPDIQAGCPQNGGDRMHYKQGKLYK